MAKARTTYFCQSCGAQSAKWLGRCPTCGEWNTYVEEVVKPATGGSGGAVAGWRPASGGGRAPQSRPVPINDIVVRDQPRFLTSDEELNRVLGGGIVPGALVLIGGEPGIGKSTLMLQIATSLDGQRVLYVSGEESEQQIRMRAERLGTLAADCFILTETNTQNIFLQIQEVGPTIVIVDSIQTLYTDAVESGAGSVSQVRECTAELLRFAKESNVPVFLIGHITKDGSIAGPKVLEHMVDTVLQFEGDRHTSYRILRAVKNRFGPAAELGIYEMRGAGLRQVSNPSEILLSQRTEPVSGVSIGATMEGNRPLLIEVQALVSPATYGTPQRSATGFDLRRLQMLLAVLEKRGGFRLGTQDVFLNIAGGLKIDDPALDLAVCAAIVSSFNDLPLPDGTCLAAEIGLSGEVRPVGRVEARIGEAEKLGFREIYIAQAGPTPEQKRKGIRVRSVAKLEDAIVGLFE